MKKIVKYFMEDVHDKLEEINYDFNELGERKLRMKKAVRINHWA